MTHNSQVFLKSQQAVHVWKMSINQMISMEQKFRRLLSVDELLKSERFRFDKDRQEYILARGILRVILASYLKCDPNEIQFGYTNQGKPFIANSVKESGLGFNLSHSFGNCVYAIAWDREVGIDLEQVRPVPEWKKIALNYFSPAENNWLEELAPAEQLTGFFRCWTRKESHLKAIGTGFGEMNEKLRLDSKAKSDGLSMNSFKYQDSFALSDWSIVDLITDPSYCGAICMSGQGWNLKYIEMDLFQLCDQYYPVSMRDVQ